MERPELFRPDHPANAAVLAHLRVAERGPESAAPDEVEDPHQGLGAHPDAVERLWEGLGGALPEDGRWIVCGRVALVQPRSGVLLGWAGGTEYVLRVCAADFATALAGGWKTAKEFPPYPFAGITASRWDLGTIGPEWVFGRFRDEEKGWVRASWDVWAR